MFSTLLENRWLDFGQVGNIELNCNWIFMHVIEFIEFLKLCL